MINCSVTVMLIFQGRIGFLRRDKGDTYQGQLVAPGGKVESNDGILIGGVPYWSIEQAAIREIEEEIGIKLHQEQLRYFCSLTLPNGRVVISLYCRLSPSQYHNVARLLEFYTEAEIGCRDDFAPGMKEEAMLLLERVV